MRPSPPPPPRRTFAAPAPSRTVAATAPEGGGRGTPERECVRAALPVLVSESVLESEPEGVGNVERVEVWVVCAGSDAGEQAGFCWGRLSMPLPLTPAAAPAMMHGGAYSVYKREGVPHELRLFGLSRREHPRVSAPSSQGVP